MSQLGVVAINVLQGEVQKPMVAGLSGEKDLLPIDSPAVE